MTVLSLHSWLDPGWLPENFGFYLHAGRVYITGRLVNNTEWQEEEAESKAPPSRVICRGLPGALRPSAPVKVVLPSGRPTDYPANPILDPAQEYDTTIYPDGLWLLDSLADRFVNAPTGWEAYVFDTESGKYVKGQQYTRPLQLVLVTGNASWPVGALADSYALGAVPLVEGAPFTGTPEAAPHQQREHLGGILTTATDTEGTESIISTPELDAADRLIDGKEGDWTWATGPGGWRVPLHIGAQVRLEIDSTFGRPASDSPPLQITSGFGKRDLIGGWFGGVPYAANFQTLLPVPPGDVSSPGEQRIRKEKRTLDYFECGGRVCIGVTTAPTIRFEPLRVLAAVWPPPPWFMLYFEFVVFTPPSVDYTQGNVGCEEREGSAVCKPWTLLGVPPVFTPYELFQYYAPEPTPSGSGVLVPPAALYKGDPHVRTVTPFGEVEGWPTSAAQPYIWRHDQCPASVTLSWPEFQANRIVVEGRMRLLPLWEQRQWVLHSGDALDLTPTGYPRRYVSTGHVDIGPVTQAAIPREED